MGNLNSAVRRIYAAILLAAATTWGSLAFAGDVTIFAAASMQNVMDELNAAYEKTHPDTHIVASYAASSALAKQIENGAPADLFISADLQWMDYVQRYRLIRNDTRKNLVGNHLVLVAPAKSTETVAITKGMDMAKLLGDGYLAVGDPDSVPAGKYARASLEWMGAWGKVITKLARAENVRSALAFVSLGECPYGIVYQSDAADEPRVRVVGTFPEESHPPILYPIALTRKAVPEAQQVYDFLVSEDAKQVLLQHQFTAP